MKPVQAERIEKILLNEREAAAALGVGVNLLRRWRMANRGPTLREVVRTNRPYRRKSCLPNRSSLRVARILAVRGKQSLGECGLSATKSPPQWAGGGFGMRLYQDYAPPQRKSTRHPDRAFLPRHMVTHPG
jgi:hypothetical protein